MGARSVLFAAAAGLLAIASPAASDTVDPEYRELVTRYARGERALALAGVARFSDAEMVRIARAVTAAEPAIPLRAAVMLHLDLDYAKRPESAGTEQRRRCPGTQAAIAARYAGLLAGQEETRSFARRFFVSLAQSCQWDACLREQEIGRASCRERVFRVV